jgi:hypothetical protein
MVPECGYESRHQKKNWPIIWPPDRDCFDRQIKTAKQPRREVATATHALQNEPNLLNDVRFRG